MVTTPESWEADSAVMSACSRCMPLGGRRRALSGWWRYWAPMLSFLTGPERLGVTLSEPLPPMGFCLTACTVEEEEEEEGQLSHHSDVRATTLVCPG